ncbi:MAG TPA: hypothetical protein VKT77_18170 [Chthonomonadaceae bacterium]|nr:hypothetical protein [Chthonomonadaceae bacterium]
MNDKKRALRRHHRQRMLARALKSWRVAGNCEEFKIAVAVRLYNNMQCCSCWLCGNRRKHWGLTVREIRWANAERRDPFKSPAYVVLTLEATPRRAE